jgi:hypothetical protein
MIEEGGFAPAMIRLARKVSMSDADLAVRRFDEWGTAEDRNLYIGTQLELDIHDIFTQKKGTI